MRARTALASGRERDHETSVRTQHSPLYTIISAISCPVFDNILKFNLEHLNRFLTCAILNERVLRQHNKYLKLPGNILIKNVLKEFLI